MIQLTNRQLSDTRLNQGETLSYMVGSHELSCRSCLPNASDKRAKLDGGTWTQGTDGGKFGHPTGGGKFRQTRDEDVSTPQRALKQAHNFGILSDVCG